jgi:hypothetical protein
MRLSFDADHLRRLLDLSRAAEQRLPALEQLLDPSFWRDDLPEARITLLEGEITEHGIALSARSEDVDPTLIAPGLILVGDEGVYLMANVPNETVLAAGVAHVAYAAEVNPKTLPFDVWWEAKRASFGPDDGTVFLSEEMLTGALSRVPSGGSLLLEVSPEQIGVLEPREPGPEI